ncbi:SURF4-domain-containing protein [Neoconidiobolus thromboides FSU 785]|nr:SURF4-domain-containing protein [Neoconidiobolus thromboides FSU 785]
MLICSTLAVQRKYTEYAVAGLVGVVISQAIGYGMVFDFKFILYNFSVIGGLLMLLSENLLAKRKQVFAGLPSITQTEKSTYILLAGRILLVFLFLGFVFAGEFTLFRAVVSVIGLVACGMIAVGFKAKWSALFMVLFLSILNIFVNNWWSLSDHHFERDHAKYDFFQTLSTVGGFLLLASVGPGGFSMDEKKKNF